MPHRVLVVDDEENIRSLVKEYLEDQGFQVFAESDGVKGIKALSVCLPHLCVIDFLLPKKNGFAVAEAVRMQKGGAKIPIIMMSGVFKNPKTAVEAREKYQVVEFLQKPLDMEQLSKLVQDCLRGVDPGPDLPEPEPEPASEPKLAVVRRKSSVRKVAPRGLSYGPPTLSPEDTERPEDVGDEPNEIIDGVFMGRPFPHLDEEGSIEQLPVSLLLSSIRFDHGTGMLDLTDHGTHRRIYIIRGNPTFMQSNAEGENVGALLLRRGRITEPDFARCQRYMKDKGRTLQQSLLELRLVSEHDLATAYKLLAGQLLPLALGMAGGTYRWRLTDAFVGRVPEGKFEPVAVLLDGIKRHVHPPQILKFFRGREDIPLVKTREFDKLMPFFRRTFSAANVASQVDGHGTYRTITRDNGDAATVVPQLFALVTSGMTVLPEVNEDNAMEVAVNFAAAEIAKIGSEVEAPLELAFADDSQGNELSGDSATIQRMHDQVMSQNFFQIFSATPKTELDEIKASYFELAKRWHADAFADQHIGAGAQRKVDEIFARITEAYETITDKQKREEYLLYLDRKEKGLPTDVGEIMRAEKLFEQATAMIRRRDWRKAKQVLDEAVTLNPDPTYFATLGWVVFNLNPRSQAHVTEAVQHLKRSVQEQANLALAYQYMGQISFNRGKYSEAKRWWKKCLSLEPNNIEAARGMRIVNERGDPDDPNQSGGLLGKFLNKK